MFALVRDLAADRDVSEIAIDPGTVQRHLLAPLAGCRGAAQLADDVVRSTVAWARIERELPAIVSALIGAGVRVAPIKGVSYARGVYRAPAERPMTDIDLLVPPGREGDAARVLERLGFARDRSAALHHATPWSRDGLVIDLHHAIIGAGRSRVDLPAVWDRAVEGWPAGASRLEPVDELVFHLVHMIRNRLCGPLIHVIDTHRLLARARASEAVARAAAWGLDAPVQLALRFCRELVAGHPKPGGWLAPSPEDVVALRPSRTARKLVFDIATAGSPAQLAARAAGYMATRMPSRSS